MDVPRLQRRWPYREVYFRPANARVTTLQLNESKVKGIRGLFADAENDRVDNFGARRSGCTLKEGDAPLVLLAVGPEGFLAGGFGGSGLRERTHTLSGLRSFSGSRTALSRESGFLTG